MIHNPAVGSDNPTAGPFWVTDPLKDSCMTSDPVVGLVNPTMEPLWVINSLCIISLWSVNLIKRLFGVCNQL